MTTPRRSSAINAGFTLIEALVAIVLVAVVLPVALAAVTQSLRGADAIRKQDIALRVAQSRIAALVADGSWASSGSSGACDLHSDGEDTEGMRWQMQVSTWRDPTVHTLKFTVSWGSVSAPHSISLTTLVIPKLTGGT
jgi:type II secretion system protein I